MLSMMTSFNCNVPGSAAQSRQERRRVEDWRLDNRLSRLFELALTLGSPLFYSSAGELSFFLRPTHPQIIMAWQQGTQNVSFLSRPFSIIQMPLLLPFIKHQQPSAAQLLPARGHSQPSAASEPRPAQHQVYLASWGLCYCSTTYNTFLPLSYSFFTFRSHPYNY